MSDSNSLDAARLSKIAALLGSPVEGERIAAFEAVRRTLENSGLTFADIIRVPPVGGAWRIRARELLEIPGLNDWERAFLQGIARWHGKALSPKQAQMLDEIEAANGV